MVIAITIKPAIPLSYLTIVINENLYHTKLIYLLLISIVLCQLYACLHQKVNSQKNMKIYFILIHLHYLYTHTRRVRHVN